ncbi:hypothetical protein [Nonomuraea sp. NPDC005692]|uniref:hypothetical protein n=1 Tax=Nonomuraea sp. NPDC005692 TaxID=3157168 RepID=UPI0033FA5F39
MISSPSTASGEHGLRGEAVVQQLVMGERSDAVLVSAQSEKRLHLADPAYEGQAPQIAQLIVLGQPGHIGVGVRHPHHLIC